MKLSDIEVEFNKLSFSENDTLFVKIINTPATPSQRHEVINHFMSAAKRAIPESVKKVIFFKDDVEFELKKDCNNGD